MKRHLFFLYFFFTTFFIFSQNNCYSDVIPCNFPCSEYVINEDGCPVCECSDGWTPINEDGCYDSNGVTYSPGEEFFITECEYVICLEVADGWGGFLVNGIWSETFTEDSCDETLNNTCTENISIPSDESEVFTILDNELILVPIYTTGEISVSSFQFNMIFNHEFVNYELSNIGEINNTLYYNNYNIPPALSNTANGGAFSSNVTQIDNNYSMLTIAYATSQIETMDEILLYIPFSTNSQEGCFELSFSDGLFENEYIFPNQTNELLISNQDLSECAFDGTICFSCVDSNENSICDNEEIEGCIDETACNYDSIATEDDGSCEYAEEYYDCDDNPINDEDEDGIPDELEEDGCTNELACNYNLYATQDDGSCFFAGDCGDCESLGVIQSIELNDGWSLFSTYICPFEPNFESIMEELVNNNSIVILKNGSGSVYWPAFGINQIGDLVNGMGYLVKTQNEAILNVYGTVLNYNSPINIQTGWSYLGYLYQECYSAMDMMFPIIDDLIILKDENGLVYWPFFEINAIGNMCPGEGYQINVENEVTFSYPSADGARYGDSYEQKLIHFSEPINTGQNMTIGLPLNSWKTTPSIGDEIAAFGEDGRLIGSTVYEENNLALTIWGDDLTTNEKDGLSEGEKIKFRWWHSQTGFEKDLEIKWLEGVGVYTIDGISIAGQIINGANITSQRQLVKITDVLGREVNGDEKDVMLLYIYDDGSTERVFFKE